MVMQPAIRQHQPIAAEHQGISGVAAHVSQANMEEELLALAEAMDDSPPDANGMAPPPGPLHVSSTQART
jgi:hypothetical protein